MKFDYVAKKGRKTVTGVIEAPDKEMGIAQLESLGYLPVQIEEVGPRVMTVKSFFPRKISQEDINGFMRELAMLVKSRLQLVKALESLSRGTLHPGLRDLIGSLAAEVSQGKPLSVALADHPKYFSRVSVSMIAAGERGGTLDKVLLRLVEYAAREDDIRNKIRSAMAYPLLMAAMGILTVVVMITFVMPKLTKLFSDMQQSLPMPTKILMGLSAFFNANWYWMALVLGVLIILAKKNRVIERNKASIEKIIFDLPLAGNYMRMRGGAQFCYTLSLMLTNGIPIRDAISATIPTIGSRIIEEELKALSSGLADGASVADCVSKSSFFPEHVISLIKVGEESGRLDEVLLEIATSYDKKVDVSLKTFSALLEPLIILAVGLVVGFIVISMILPVFEFNVR
ncbi:MAG: type II secretion system F family protein [Candidatus Omnitrophota bacterium]